MYGKSKINFSDKNNLRRTGKAGIFSGSLELAKEGNISIKQNNLFDDIYFNGEIQERSASYIPYYMKYGSLFIDILIKKLNPLEKDYIILKGF